MIQEFIQQGYSLIAKSDTYEEVVNTLDKVTNLELGNIILVPGEETTLDGFFSAPLVYCGFDDKKYMYFYLGYDNFQMFNEGHFFEKIFYVTNKRFFVHFLQSGGRDFNFTKGVWDWQRKANRFKKDNLEEY